jgi:predicted branched-subunit amino acid permease
MSVSLSQKVNARFSGLRRWLLGFFMTDEIFAVASAEDSVDPTFFLGLSVIPYLGWSGGTLVGALVGNVLPETVMNTLCLAIYGMFLAIIAPVAKAERPVLIVVAAAVALHCLFYYAPYLRDIPSGITISLCAVAAALVGALLFPIADDQEEEVSAE